MGQLVQNSGEAIHHRALGRFGIEAGVYCCGEGGRNAAVRADGLGPEVDHVVLDRLKLREAVGELLRNALAALLTAVDDWGCAPGSPKTGRGFRSRSRTMAWVPNSPL